jgi:hypothetical protein
VLAIGAGAHLQLWEGTVPRDGIIKAIGEVKKAILYGTARV